MELQNPENDDVDRYNIFHDISNEWHEVLTSDVGTYAGFDLVLPMSVFSSWLKGRKGSGICRNDWNTPADILYAADKLSVGMFTYITKNISKTTFSKLFPTNQNLTVETLKNSLLYERQSLA
jgi:hypothetical protein